MPPKELTQSLLDITEEAKDTLAGILLRNCSIQNATIRADLPQLKNFVAISSPIDTLDLSMQNWTRLFSIEVEGIFDKVPESFKLAPPNLERILIHKSSIDEIPSWTKDHWQNVHMIRIDSSELQYCPHELLELSSLIKLQLRRNHIHTLEDAPKTEVIMVELAHNNITSIPQGYKDIQWLDIGHNNIDETAVPWTVPELIENNGRIVLVGNPICENVPELNTTDICKGFVFPK